MTDKFFQLHVDVPNDECLEAIGRLCSYYGTKHSSLAKAERAARHIIKGMGTKTIDPVNVSVEIVEHVRTERRVALLTSKLLREYRAADKKRREANRIARAKAKALPFIVTGRLLGPRQNVRPE